MKSTVTLEKNIFKTFNIIENTFYEILEFLNFFLEFWLLKFSEKNEK